MIHDDPMPDFVAALEARLRAAALEQSGAPAGTVAGESDVPGESGVPGAPGVPSRAPAPRDPGYRPSFRERLAGHRPTRRRALGAAVLVLATLVALVMAITVRTPPAISGPDILNAPRVTDPEYLRRLMSDSRSMGPGADYARARVVQAVGGRAYLVPTRRGDWCLRVPMPGGGPGGVGEAKRGYAVSCATDAEFRRVGIPVLSGDTLVAAVANGVRAPTLRGPGGRVRTLKPNALGVVVVRHLRGSTYTQFARSGPPFEVTVDATTGMPMETGAPGSGAGGGSGVPPSGRPVPVPAPSGPVGRAGPPTVVPCPPSGPAAAFCERRNRRIIARRERAKRRAAARAAERAAGRRPGP